MIDPIRETLLSPKEAAARVRVSPRTIWNWIQEGRLDACRVGRSVRTSVEALKRFTAPYTPAGSVSVPVAPLTQGERDLIALREEHGLNV